VDYKLNIENLNNPADLQKLKSAISELAFDLDAIYTTTAPNLNISARQGVRAIYLNGATYEYWVNVDGGTVWQRQAGQSDVVLLTGDQTIAGIKTFSSIPILPASDPTTDHQAARKLYVDGKFNTTTGHDHDNSDSKKVLATNLDATGISTGHYLQESSGGIAGANPIAQATAGSIHANQTTGLGIGNCDTERTTQSTTYVKTKSIVVPKAGTLTIKFDLKAGQVSDIVYGAIYRNGALVGTPQTDSTAAYVTKSEDIAGWSIGDECQLYIHDNTPPHTCYVRNFRIYEANPPIYSVVYDQNPP